MRENAHDPEIRVGEWRHHRVNLSWPFGWSEIDFTSIVLTLQWAYLWMCFLQISRQTSGFLVARNSELPQFYRSKIIYFELIYLENIFILYSFFYWFLHTIHEKFRISRWNSLLNSLRIFLETIPRRDQRDYFIKLTLSREKA